MRRWPRLISTLLLGVLGLQLAGSGARCVMGDAPAATGVVAGQHHAHSPECPPPDHQPAPKHPASHHGECAMLSHCLSVTVLPVLAARPAVPEAMGTTPVLVATFIPTVSTRPTPPPPRA